ncbi:MAG: hypothetical protein CL478_00370, partial [Acidobacteria bacterium]|nr:hypothetical protein [Acidobacteriota bacterium]
MLFPRSIWALFVVCLILATWLQMSQAPILDRTVFADQGTTNVITFVLFIICALTSGVWFAFFGAFERNLRLGVPLALVGLVVVFFTLFRIDSVGGDL